MNSKTIWVVEFNRDDEPVFSHVHFAEATALKEAKSVNVLSGGREEVIVRKTELQESPRKVLKEEVVFRRKRY